MNQLTTYIRRIFNHSAVVVTAFGLLFAFAVPVFAQSAAPTNGGTNTNNTNSNNAAPTNGGTNGGQGGSSSGGGASVDSSVCAGIVATGGSCDDTNGDSFQKIVKTVINVLSIAVGAVCVIMIIVGGFRYVVSNGDSNGLSGAKNTILYAIVGLVIVLFAQLIVQFVYSNVTKQTGP